ncbi:hypothetical protein FRB94_006341 [Tulasnella sp. JGI-2019a]|nr:hypothetical protein FRB94_006341 [Tulasnella sp. JGI-2019a]KAG9007276.1 hypothetical protein FRB93_008099 [Tulasnella sp. JGI-2019a]KAG9033585.1 hypothetical protein FRB95_014663 [Tulasnella sp. JGI-2019a]
MSTMEIPKDVLCHSAAPLEPLEGAPLDQPVDTYVRQVWFKSEPLDRSIIYRLAQIQLVTKSRDQGWVDDDVRNAGSWSWFEVAIYADKDATSPRTRHNGELLQWKSHHNAFALPATTKHYGLVFDRRGQLLDDLEPGNVIVVHACVRFQGWENHADLGYIDMKLLKEELFSPQSWTLKSKERPDEEIDVGFGIYTVSSTTQCRVKATSDETESKIWFTTPILDQGTIEGMAELQLWTEAVCRGPGAHFDIVILDSPEATTPKVKNGYVMVWSSHDIYDDKEYILHDGLRFERNSDIMGALEAGDVIGVRASTRFSGSELHGKDGQLVIRIANKEKKLQTQFPDSTSLVKSVKKFERRNAENIAEKAAEKAAEDDSVPPPPYIEVLQTGELRADDAKARPLQLLCLDGGGVRGVASLRILKTIMVEVSKRIGKGDIKPCDYFDMIGGTSTGGLLAIMLGRLKMSITECETAYKDVSEKIFGKGLSEEVAFATGETMYSGKVVEDAIKSLLRGRNLDPDLAMKAENESDCKVFVMATRADALGTKDAQAFLRTYHQYNQRSNDYEHWKIWQAARATSAAPLYFPKMKVDEKEFVDGGLLCNNPVSQLYTESRLTFGTARPIGCILSIGTGIPPGTYISDPKFTKLTSFVSAITTAATDCEVKHENMQNIAPVFPLLGDEEKYWRFNVTTSKLPDKSILEGAASWVKGLFVSKTLPVDLILKLDDYKNMQRFVDWTDIWLKTQTGDITKCAGRLHNLVDEKGIRK